MANGENGDSQDQDPITLFEVGGERNQTATIPEGQSEPSPFEQLFAPEEDGREEETTTPTQTVDVPSLSDIPAPSAEESPEEYFQREDVREPLSRVIGAARENPQAYDPEQRRAIQELATRAMGVLGSRGNTQERRPRADVEKQELLEGWGNDFMRGVNLIQEAGFRLAETGSDALGLEDAEAFFEQQAEGELEDAASYERSEEVERFQQKINEKGLREAFSEDWTSGLRWLSSRAVETSPTFATAAAGQLIPGVGQLAGAMATGMALETGFQLSDATYNDQGFEREPTGGEQAMALLSGVMAGSLEGLGATRAIPLGNKIDDIVRSSLPEEVVPKAMQEIGQRTRKLAVDLVGEAAAKTAGGTGRGAVSEGLTEGLQSIVNDVGAKYGWDRDRPVGETVFQEALIGSTVGGVGGGVMSAAQQAAGAQTPEVESLQRAARNAPIDEARRLFNEAESAEAKRALGRVIEERLRGQAPEGPTRETEATPERREGRPEPETLQEVFQSVEQGATQQEAGAEDTEESPAQDALEDLSDEELGARAAEATLDELDAIRREAARREGTLDEAPEDPSSEPTQMLVRQAAAADPESAAKATLLGELDQRLQERRASAEPEAEGQDSPTVEVREGDLQIQRGDEQQTLSEFTVERNEDGAPTRLQGQTSDGETVTIDNPAVAGQAALQQTLSETGVAPEAGGRDLPDLQPLRDAVASVQTQIRDLAEQEGGVTETQIEDLRGALQSIEEEVSSVGEEAEDADVDTEAVQSTISNLRSALPNLSEEGKETSMAALTDEAQALGQATEDLSTPEAEPGAGGAESIRDVLENIGEGQISQDDRSAIQGTVLSGVSEVEQAVGLALSGETDSLAPEEAQRGADWARETAEDLSQLVQDGQLDPEGEEVARRLQTDVFQPIEQRLQARAPTGTQGGGARSVEARDDSAPSREEQVDVDTSSFEGFAESAGLSPVYDFLYRLADTLVDSINGELTLEIGGLDRSGARGVFEQDSMTIRISPSLVREGGQQLEETLAHEIIHAVLWSKTVRGELDPELFSALQDIAQRVQTWLNEQAEQRSLTAAELQTLQLVGQLLQGNRSDAAELITYGLTNPEAAQVLGQIPAETGTQGTTNSVWERLKSVIREAIETITGRTQLDRLTEAIEAHLDNPTQLSEIGGGSQSTPTAQPTPERPSRGGAQELTGAQAPPQANVAPEAQMEEAMAVVDTAIREQGLSPEIRPVLRQALESPSFPITGSEGVRRALSLGRALQEVTGSPTVRPTEIREALDIIAQGGLRRAINNATDEDVIQRYDEMLGVLDRAQERAGAQESLLDQIEDLEDTSSARERVRSQIEQIKAQQSQLRRQIEDRRQEIAQQAADQRQQGDLLQDQGGPQAEQQGMFGSPGTGEQGEITAEDTAQARERDSRLQELQAELQDLSDRRARLELNLNQLAQEVREVSTPMDFRQAGQEEIVSKTEATGVTKSGSEDPYTVGIAGAGIQRQSGGRTTYERQAGQVLVLAPDGTPVSRQSSNHDAAVLSALTDPEGVIEQLADPERTVASEARTEQEVTPERVAAESESIFEIARTWLGVDTSKTLIERTAEGTQFPPDSVVRAVEMADVSQDVDPESGYNLWKSNSATRDIDSMAEGLSRELPGISEEEIVQRIATIIATHPGQNKSLQTRGVRQRRSLEDRFGQVAGFSLGPDPVAREQFATRLLAARRRARIVQRIREARATPDQEPQIMASVVRTMESGDKVTTPGDLLGDGPLSITDQLTETQRRALREAWAEYHHDLDEVPFQRLDVQLDPAGQGGLTAEAAVQIVEGVAEAEARAEGLPDANVVRNPSDLPGGAREKFEYHAAKYPGFAQPAFVDGDAIHIVTSHLAAAAQAQEKPLADMTRETLLHEWSHRGMEDLWGEEYETVMAGLYDEIGRTEIENELGSAYDARFVGTISPADKAFLADEYLASKAENTQDTDPSLIRRIWLYIREQWQRVFGTRLSDAEVTRLLIGAYDAARGEAVGATITGTRFMMVGPGARTFEEEGAFRNPYDELLRNEIGDRQAQVQGPLRDLVEGRQEAVGAQSELAGGEEQPAPVRSSLRRDRILGLSRAAEGEEVLEDGLPLPEVFEHERLYEAYPELRDLTVRYDPNLDTAAGMGFLQNEIVVGTRAFQGDADQAVEEVRQALKGVLLHEIQHKIQDLEGWQNGANYQTAREIIQRQAEEAGIDPENDTAVMNWAEAEYDTTFQGAVQEVYRRVAGEVEARETTRRQQMNMLERAVRPPFVRGDELVPGAEEVFTQSAVPDLTPSLKAMRVAVNGGQNPTSTTQQGPSIRFSRQSLEGTPFSRAEQSVNEDLESGELRLEDVVPVQTKNTPELVAAGRPAPPDAPLPAWADEGGAETSEGSRLLSRLRSDPEGTDVGARSIVGFAVDQIYPEFQRFLNNVDQTSWLDFGETARMLFRLLEDTGSLPEQLAFDQSRAQIKRIGLGRVDDSLTDEEIFVEWTRLYVKSPGTVEGLALTNKIEAALDETNTDLLKTLRDAARAWQAHATRSVEAQIRSYEEDTGAEGSLTESPAESGIRDTIDSLLYHWVASGHAIERAERHVFRSLQAATNEQESFVDRIKRLTGLADSEATEEARRVLSEFRDANVRPRAWHQAGLRARGATARAIDGRRGRKRGGMMFLATDTTLSQEEIEMLAEATDIMDETVEWSSPANPTGAPSDGDGTNVSMTEGTLREALQRVQEGEALWLTDQPFVELFEPIADDQVDAFEHYAKRKVQLARHRADVADSLQPENTTADERQAVAQAARELLAESDLAGDEAQAVEDALSDYVKDLGPIDPVMDALPEMAGEAWVRHNTPIEPNAQPFPGAADIEVSEIREHVASAESRHPKWVDVFEEMEAFADKALIMAVAGGLKSAEEAAAMMNAHDAYLPLMRKVDATSAIGGAGAWPDAGIREAEGSRIPTRPLIKNFEQRLQSIYEGYYHNAAMLSIIRMMEHTAQDESLPFQTREMARNVVQEIHREPRVVANLSSSEIKSIVAAELGPEVSPEDITVDQSSRPVVRMQVADGPDVIAPLVDGDRVFYRVSDPILLDYFAKTGARPNETVDALTQPFRDVVAPWKRAITQNLIFTIRQLGFREPATAIGLGLPPEASIERRVDRAKTMAPYYSISVGLVENWTGTQVPDNAPVGELLSDSYQATNTNPDRTRVDKSNWEQFKAVLTQGVLRDDYTSLSWAERLRAAPGQLMSAFMKIVEVPLWATQQRRISIAAEESNRLGAFRIAREAGETVAEAAQAYDNIAGNFGEHPASGTMHSIYKVGGFVNPALQITYQLMRRVFSMDPAVRRQTLITRFGAIAAFTAAAWALNQILTPDERKDELDERSDKEKLRNIPLGGVFRLPFDHGPIGTVQSFTYNLLEMQAGRGVNDRSEMAWTLLTRFVESPVTSPTGLVNPQIKSIIEAEANYSFYFESPIVPSVYEHQPPAEQAPADVPSEYKFVGELTNTSPLKVEHIVDSGLAYQVNEMLQFKAEVQRGEADLGDFFSSENPFIERIFQRDPIGWRSQSVQTVAEKAADYDAAERDYENMREKMPADPSDAYEKRMRELQTRMRKLRGHKRAMEQVRAWWTRADRATNEQNYEQAKQMERRMTEVAENFLEEQRGRQ